MTPLSACSRVSAATTCGQNGHFSYEKDKCPKGGEGSATQLTTVDDDGSADGSVADTEPDAAADDEGDEEDEYELVDGFGGDEGDDAGDNIHTVHLAFLSMHTRCLI